MKFSIPQKGTSEYELLKKAKEVISNPNTVLIHGIPLSRAKEIVNRYK